MTYQRRKAQRPDEILTAALQVFSDKGFSAARMSDIAKFAGVSRPALYQYFPNKGAIFEALLDRHMVPVIGQSSAVVQAHEGSASDLLRQVMARFFELSQRPEVQIILHLILMEGRQFPELTQTHLDRLFHPAQAAFGQVIRRGVNLGEFRPEYRDIDIRQIMAPVMMGVVWKASFGEVEAPDMPNLLASHIDLTLRGLQVAP